MSTIVETSLTSTASTVKRRLNFSDSSKHEEHVQALLIWLHPDLRDLPGIDWTKLPSRVIGYLLQTVKDAPYAPHVALAVGCMLQSNVALSYLVTTVSAFNVLLRTMTQICNEAWKGTTITKSVWEEYISKTKQTSGRRRGLLTYSILTETYIPDYLENLPSSVQKKIAPYVLSRLPTRFLEHHAGTRELVAAGEKRRKQKTDILVPLHSILVALVQFRKQSAQRLYDAFREARSQAEAGAMLPLTFRYEDAIAEVNHDARTVAEIRIEKHPVVLEFKLWNRRSWVIHHADDFTKRPFYQIKHNAGAYAPEADQYFVQYLGKYSDLLWCGDILAQGLFQNLTEQRQLYRRNQEHVSEASRTRIRPAEKLGVPEGFTVKRPGVLTPAGALGKWLRAYGDLNRTLLFDPESLYLGTLFGAALVMLALTNGSRVGELLQVSADRFKGHPYEESKNGQVIDKKRTLWLQHLLPKGKKTEEERQLFPISPQAYELLREIGSFLKGYHGYIPTVHSHQDHKKLNDLTPERYLFQWYASSDGRFGAFAPHDVTVLIRFILHGLEFHTKDGEPFAVSAHLLRHVMATAARHAYDVPAEAIAYVLHHQQDGCAIPIATQYYSQRTEEQQLTDLAEFQFDVEEQASTIILAMPSERTLAQMEEDLRDVFERWQTLLETAFGFCGRVGLCPRGYQRCLCIGCPYLVPNPAKIQEAVKWQSAYVEQAETLEQEGALVDARQVRLQIKELNDLINSMHILQQAIDDGTHHPLFLHLPATKYDEARYNA